MKRLYLLVAFLAIAGSLLSCQKEISDTSAIQQNGASGSFRAKFNGNLWTAAQASASRIGGLTSISGMGSKKLVTITLSDTIVGTYRLTDTSMQVGVLVDSLLGSNFPFATNESDDTAKAGGVVNITNINKTAKTISGTFRFKVYRMQDSVSINVTEGAFENLSYATALPTASTTDTFRVKIDGVDFNPPTIVGINSMGLFGISGTTSTGGKTVGFQMPPNITAGSYALAGIAGTSGVVGLYNPTATTSMEATSGTLQVLEHNTATRRIRANFNFTATPAFGGAGTPAVLTQGYFSVRYQ
ncbi:MAG: hypothetical protein JWP88_499 [Flaviaesturariibacter sp.]|nr:hypothetical protein [Flaviaesturariibacter sp.]